MLSRRLLPALTAALAETPAVALLGPRQVGKTTLAHEVAKARPSVYLDLESEADRAKLSEPELYLARHADTLVVFDEFQRAAALPDAARVDSDQVRCAEGREPRLLRARRVDAAMRDERFFEARR